MGEMNQYDSFVTYKFPALSSWISRACPDLCSPPVSLRCTLDSLVSSLWRYLELSQYALQHRCLFRSVSHPSIYLHWIQWDSSAHKFTVQQLMIVSLLNLLVMVLDEAMSINTQKIFTLHSYKKEKRHVFGWKKPPNKQTNKCMHINLSLQCLFAYLSLLSIHLFVSIQTIYIVTVLCHLSVSLSSCLFTQCVCTFAFLRSMHTSILKACSFVCLPTQQRGDTRAGQGPGPMAESQLIPLPARMTTCSRSRDTVAPLGQRKV